ncbi:hypothetical protein, partial [Streptomyces sp. NPDC005077]|uniref:hypothetical protein n=1 Tax=Streptomyces sp. NPDC005077 TaxID=3154292 RepID=UPI0033B0FB53
TWHSAAGLDARLHPLVRDTSRPAPGPDLLAFAELAARLLKAAAEAAGETGEPPRTRRRGRPGSCWRRTLP